MTEEANKYISGSMNGIVNISIIYGRTLQTPEGKKVHQVDGIEKETYSISIPEDDIDSASEYVRKSLKTIKQENFDAFPAKGGKIGKQ